MLLVQKLNCTRMFLEKTRHGARPDRKPEKNMTRYLGRSRSQTLHPWRREYPKEDGRGSGLHRNRGHVPIRHGSVGESSCGGVCPRTTGASSRLPGPVGRGVTFWHISSSVGIAHGGLELKSGQEVSWSFFPRPNSAHSPLPRRCPPGDQWKRLPCPPTRWG